MDRSRVGGNCLTLPQAGPKFRIDPPTQRIEGRCFRRRSRTPREIGGPLAWKLPESDRPGSRLRSANAGGGRDDSGGSTPNPFPDFMIRLSGRFERQAGPPGLVTIAGRTGNLRRQGIQDNRWQESAAATRSEGGVPQAVPTFSWSELWVPVPRGRPGSNRDDLFTPPWDEGGRKAADSSAGGTPANRTFHPGPIRRLTSVAA